MLNLPLMRRTFRDHALLWAALMLLVMTVLVLYTLVIHSGAFDHKQDFIKLPFVRRFMTVMIGSDPLTYLSPTAIAAFGFTHPLVWALLVIFAISAGTGSLAGEMDRGTMDLLAALPISRGSLYVSIGVTLLLMGVPMCWAVWFGAAVGRYIVGASDVRLEVLVKVTWHLYCVFVLIASFTLALSAMNSRRGPAVAISFFLVFYAFLLNVLRAMWPPLDVMAWSDFLHYYQSMQIVRDESYRWKDMAVLLGAAAAWWMAGLVTFGRRDIPAR